MADLTRDEIIGCYLLSFGRSPESESIIEFYLSLSKVEFYRFITSSAEFSAKVAQLGAASKFGLFPTKSPVVGGDILLVSNDGPAICISRETFILLQDGKIESVSHTVFKNGQIALRDRNLWLSYMWGDVHPTFKESLLSPRTFFTVLRVTDSALVIGNLEFVPLNEGGGEARCVAILDDKVETLSSPLTISENDALWFEDSPKNFFPVRSGEFRIPENYIYLAKDKFLSVKYGAHGVIFDRTGFYHNAGFLGLRSDFEHLSIAEHGFVVDFDKIETSRYLFGSYSAPFDGNSFNYYHWLLEGIFTIFLMKFYNVYRRPIVPVGRDRLRNWQRQYLQIMGVEDHIIIDGEDVDIVVVEEITYLWHRDIYLVNGCLLKRFRQFILDVIGSSDPTAPNVSSEALVYIKRGTGSRSLTNGDEIENFLIKKGFLIVDLDGLDVSTQVRIFSTARIVVGVHGAGLANILYCRPNTIVVELIPEPEVRNCFWLLSEKMDLVHAVLQCRAANGYAGEITVDVHALDLLIERCINVSPPL